MTVGALPSGAWPAQEGGPAEPNTLQVSRPIGIPNRWLRVPSGGTPGGAERAAPQGPMWPMQIVIGGACVFFIWYAWMMGQKRVLR